VVTERRTRWHIGTCRTYDDCPEWPRHIRDRCDDHYCTLEHVTIIREGNHQLDVDDIDIDPDGGVTIRGRITDPELVAALCHGATSGLSVEIDEH
jgi:hypothetical protein